MKTAGKLGEILRWLLKKQLRLDTAYLLTRVRLMHSFTDDAHQKRMKYRRKIHPMVSAVMALSYASLSDFMAFMGIT